jgi:xanthine dehydrogenase/oxidase
MGQGLHTKMIQIAAKSLGMPIENIHVLETTTSAVINASPTAASFSTDLLGPAVKNACDELATRIKPVRDELGEGWTWSNIARQAYSSKIDCTARGYARGPDIDFDWDKGEVRYLRFLLCAESNLLCDSRVTQCNIIHVVPPMQRSKWTF